MRILFVFVFLLGLVSCDFIEKSSDFINNLMGNNQENSKYQRRTDKKDENLRLENTESKIKEKYTEEKKKNKTQKNIFTIKNNGETIEIARYDLKKDNWHEKINFMNAKTMLHNMGDGWRLPTVDELEIIYYKFYKKKKGDFKEFGVYWSSEQECNICPVWTVKFDVLYSDTYKTQDYEYCYVRPVRTLY